MESNRIESRITRDFKLIAVNKHFLGVKHTSLKNTPLH